MDPRAETTGDEPVVRIIKRYANRKLYDTRDSCYVTLPQIAELVRLGEEIQIIDNRTKEDLTNVTLAQIVYEQEKRGEVEGASSARSLRSLIQEGRNRLMTSLRDGPVGKLVGRKEVDEVAPPDPPTDPRRSPKEALDELGRLADERVRGVVATAMGHVQQLQAEVRRLQERIEELEERIRRMGRRGRADDPRGEGDTAGGDPPEDESGPGASDG